MDDIKEFSPFHWVLEFAEAYSEGGFDVMVGNPPWEVLEKNREDYFTQFDPIFRTRSMNEKDQKKEELLEDPDIKEGWEDHKQKMEIRASYFNKSNQYHLQEPEIDGKNRGGKNDLSNLFLERARDLAKEESYISQILPGSVYLGAAGKDLREEFIENASVKSTALFENKTIFGGVDNRYKFGVLTAKNSGSTENLKTIYTKGDTSVLRDYNDYAISISREILDKYSPEAAIFPLIDNKKKLNAIQDLIEHPALGYDKERWYFKPYQEINRNSDRDRYTESKEKGDYPVYGGSSIYQFNYDDSFLNIEKPSLWSVAEDKNPEKSAKRRIREKVSRSRDPQIGVKKAIYQNLEGSGSQKKFVNNKLENTRGKSLKLEDVKLSCSEYRIVFRNISNSTNERTMISTVVPKGVVCHHAINTVRPLEFDISEDKLDEFPLRSIYKKIFSDKELFVALGLVNSLPFDYLMRSKVEENMVMYKLKETQIPKLTDGDNWFSYISERAAKLNCYGEEFEEMRERLGGIEAATDKGERKRLQAEVDAAAFHAYGLDRDEAKYVLDSFHTVDNPRMMTEDYFDMVLEKYDELDEEGPLE
jgi:hypothetical protein